METIFLQIPPEIAAQIKIPPKRAHRVLMEELVLRLYEEDPKIVAGNPGNGGPESVRDDKGGH